MNAPKARTWTDEQLAQAVGTSSSWRGVLRALGLRGTSATAIRIVRCHANRLGLDVSHIRGKRRWSDAELRQAVSESSTWEEVLTRLGLSTNGGAPPHIKGQCHPPRPRHQPPEPVEPPWAPAIRSTGGDIRPRGGPQVSPCRCSGRSHCVVRAAGWRRLVAD